MLLRLIYFRTAICKNVLASEAVDLRGELQNVPHAVGMGAVLRSLLARLDSSPWGLLQAVPPVPMAAPLRQAAVLALQAAVQVLTPVFSPRRGSFQGVHCVSNALICTCALRCPQAELAGFRAAGGLTLAYARRPNGLHCTLGGCRPSLMLLLTNLFFHAQAGGAMYGVLAADGGLVGLAAERGAQPLVPSDLLLLTNFVAAHDSFRLVRGFRFLPLSLLLTFCTSLPGIHLRTCHALENRCSRLLRRNILVWRIVVGLMSAPPDGCCVYAVLACADGEHVAHLPAAVQPGCFPPRLHPLSGSGAALLAIKFAAAAKVFTCVSSCDC